MPELPEVETVRKKLSQILINKKILDVDILYKGVIVGETEAFKKKIKNQTIHEIRRRGKYLVFVLDDYLMYSHLRMEGKYFIRELNTEIYKHEHVRFIFKDFELRYMDTRKFGKIELTSLDDNYLEDKIAYDGIDLRIDVDYLMKRIRSNKHIKTLLLDQSVIAGIGNIYADEILFMSKINPLKKGIDLSEKEVYNIISNTRIVLNEAISKGGTTIRSYTSLNGEIGTFQNDLLVHEQCICPVCHSSINKIKVNGRGTYYCPKCQKEDL